MYTGAGGGQGYAKKRKATKVGGATISIETQKNIQLDKNPNTAISLGRVQYTGANETVQYGQSHTYTQPEDKITYADLINTMFPKYTQTIIGYNANMYNSGTATAKSTAAGNDKSIYIAPGRQAWREYVALPAYTMGDYTGNEFSTSLLRLVNKSIDVSQLQYSQFGTGSPWDPSVITGPGDGEDQKINRNFKFHYTGGYQSHTFTNQGTTDVTVELFEAMPRERTALAVPESGDIYWIGPGYHLLQDYKNNQPPVQNALPASTITSFDNINDMMVGLRSNCDQTHTKWRCSKSIKTRIPPGGTFKYKMTLDSFTMRNSQWNSFIIEQPGGEGTYGGLEPDAPWLIPGFTKVLCCRFQTEIGHEDVTGTKATSFAKVGYLPGILSHISTEHHNCRFMPQVYDNAEILTNYLDIDELIVENMNTAENKPQVFADSV